MGWGWLKPVLKIGAAAAAPFTGGGSLAAMPVIDAIGGGATAASGAMTTDRSNKANLEATKLKLNQDQEQNYFKTLMDRDKAQNDNAASAFKRLLNVTYMGNPEGHVKTPGLAGQYSRAIAGPNDAQVNMSNGPLRDALYNRAAFLTDPLGGEAPTRTLDTSALDKTGKSGFWEKLLGIAGGAASAYGSLRGYADDEGEDDNSVPEWFKGN